jgi:small subunit ribosomal protein S16
MGLKIRLARHGAKKKPFYRIVVAEAASPRDGKYLAKLGTYDPKINPAAIALDLAGVDTWIKNGAIPTDTVMNLIKRYRKEAVTQTPTETPTETQVG